MDFMVHRKPQEADVENAHDQEGMLPAWLTSKQAEQLVGLSRTTLWRIARSEEGVKTARVGRSIRYSRESLLEYMDCHATQPQLPGFAGERRC